MVKLKCCARIPNLVPLFCIPSERNDIFSCFQIIWNLNFVHDGERKIFEFFTNMKTKSRKTRSWFGELGPFSAWIFIISPSVDTYTTIEKPVKYTYNRVYQKVRTKRRRRRPCSHYTG